jgi:hypothetical protein
MQLDQNPVFRKVIAPWYDSEMACWIVIMGMAAVFLFGLAGVSVSKGSPEYREHFWVPVFLLVSSGWVILSTASRLVKRYRRKKEH